VVKNIIAPSGKNMTIQPVSSPLQGIRVLELGTFIAGPFCTRLLGDFGAEVVKIESPAEGDPMRHWGRKFEGRSLWWAVQSRNKKCVSLDLRKREGQELAFQLARQCDIIVENFRPGKLESWNLGYEKLKEINPGIILVRISGFGQTGPHRDRAGFGSVAEAIGGLRYITGYPDQPPTRIGISIGDSLASVFGALGAMMALYNRTVRGGEGQVVDVAIYEAVFAMMESMLTEYEKIGYIRQPTGCVLPGIAPSNIYPAKDGRSILIAANSDNVFRRLAGIMNMPELAMDPRFSTHETRGNNMEVLDKIISDWTIQFDSTELIEKLNSPGVPAGAIYSIAEIATDEHYWARQMIVSLVDKYLGEIKMPGLIPKLSQTPGAIRWTGPELGEHNEEVYGSLLGLSGSEIRRLRQAGVI
jgi:crotonobetainyl-CoA:carnitine CoA-transferase CaiB-like acyl-CoA transferase